jgi:nucleoside-diphosphate-sugar epimerase
MKIYIVGGHGFIGRRLIKSLLSSQYTDIEVIDPKPNTENVGAYNHQGVKINNVPLNHFTRGLFIHLASNSQHNPTINESKKDLDAFLYTIGAAAMTGSGALVASTSAVSGGSTPVALYGRSAEVYSTPFKPHCRIGFMRLYSVYGPSQHDNFVQRAIKAAISGSTLTVHNPHYIRDWIHVDDVVRSIVHQVATYERTGKMMMVSHIGTGAGLPVSTALAIIRSVTGRPISVEYGRNITKNEPVVSVAQKSPPGWSAQILFESGIRQLWEYECELSEERERNSRESSDERGPEETPASNDN